MREEGGGSGAPGARFGPPPVALDGAVPVQNGTAPDARTGRRPLGREQHHAGWGSTPGAAGAHGVGGPGEPSREDDVNAGIIGLPQVGKKTLFRLLVGPDAVPAHADARAIVRGVAEIRDPRFDRLVAMYRPRRQVRARLELALLPKIEDRTIAEGTIFRDMGEIDAFCHVVRAFDDDSVYHVWGAPDPEREIETIQNELVLHDLVFVEKRLERLAKTLMKAPDARGRREQALLERFREQLEAERPLRLLEVDDEERVIISSYPLLSMRQMVVALNIGDDRIGDASLVERLAARFGDLGVHVVQIPVQAEAEIAALESPEEREEFMRELGITEPALAVLSAMLIRALGLVSFFTVGEDEVRQWFVRAGSTAPKAAGVIHSDLERGFIRAEVMKTDELLAAGSEEALRAAGKLYVRGRDYVVEDGDIVHVRFSV